MAVPNELQPFFSEFKMAEIIERLAGDKDDLHVDIHQVKFSFRKQNYEVNGSVSFHVVHKTPNAHNLKER